ncbi:MAG TPA: hypothetical protein EYN67_05440 [Flavobacteriales bacterium]|nr:hypothetical protein [Flavobacteriales bacterium]HHZ94997.1 hypothetical protein [Flavobacteriales bacterium]
MSAWSEERRQRHAEAIRRWKPWEKSTGPRTTEGKRRVAQNAYKHGGRSASVIALEKLMSALARNEREARLLV